MNSFITWIGGKKLLRKEIIECFPESFIDILKCSVGQGGFYWERIDMPKLKYTMIIIAIL